MQLAEATRKRILYLLKINHMKPYDLSKAAGIALPTLSDFMKNDTKNLRMDTMLHICEGFKITLADFYSDSIFDDVISE
ncbi:MAG: helix-turn-helix transcriptional regulator [Clostridia bacterium]|nr:helix-turn-helix transcriptional regulator [Clostridia bacterium]